MPGSSRRKSSQRSKKRKKRKSKPSRGGGNLLFIILLIIIVAAGLIFYYVQQETSLIANNAQLFVEKLEAGEVAAAEEMLYAEENGFEDFHQILSNGHLIFEGVESASLLGIVRGEAEVIFSRHDESYPLKLEFMRRDGEWGVSNLPPLKIISGAYVMEEDSLSLTVLEGEEEYTYELEESLGVERGQIVFMIVLDELVLDASETEKQTISRLLARTDEYMEGEEEGYFDLYEATPPVYKKINVSDEIPAPGGMSDLIVGRSGVTFHLHEEEITAIVLEEDYEIENIRVLLHATDFDTLAHQSIRLKGTTPLNITDKSSGEVYEIASHEEINVHHTAEGMQVEVEGREEEMGGEENIFPRRIKIEPVEEGEGRIEFPDISRDGWGEGETSYGGRIDITPADNGLYLANELPLEEYLPAVVSSEMPQGFGLEAMKAQAVIARSYAYRGILSSRFHAYGAHMDDSQNTQVYNNIPESDITAQAVEGTAGVMPLYDDEPIEAFYFSTSAGHTANMEEIWPDLATGTFTAEEVPYLQARSQVPGEEFTLHEEEAVREFLDTFYRDAYDADSPYFRWQANMSAEEMERSIEHNLEITYGQRPNTVLTRDGDDFISREIPDTPLGDLLNISVLERGEGGNIMVLEIEGTEGVYRLIGEQNVRFTLRPIQYEEDESPVVLELADGSEIDNFNSLPSGFACFEIERGEGEAVREITVKGGGFGHGVGLSQYGARNMAERGFDYAEIIEHYYPGIRLLDVDDVE